jgi:hypothetical protein
MRHILSTYAEKRRTLKRGGGFALVSLEKSYTLFDGPTAGDRTVTATATGDGDGEALLAALDEALSRMKEAHARQCRVVECQTERPRTAYAPVPVPNAPASTRTLSAVALISSWWLRRRGLSQ